MKRYGLLVALLTISLWLSAQTVGTPIWMPNTSTGTASINAPVSQPVMVAPIGHLGTAAPVAGATSATPGNLAGAVSSTMAEVPAPAPIPMVGQISVSPPVVVLAPEGTSPLLQPASGVTVSGTINPGVPFNSGVGSFSGGYPVGTVAENQNSLGEIARDFRARRATEQARTFTNQDVQRLGQTGGVSTVGGTAGAVTSAPSAAPQPSGSAPAVAQPGTTTQPTTPGVATPVPPQSQTNQPPMSQMQSSTSTEMAQATPPPGPEQTQTAPPGKQGTRRGQLPRAASVLPLMALVGFLAAAAGLMAR